MIFRQCVPGSATRDEELALGSKDKRWVKQEKTTPFSRHLKNTAHLQRTSAGGAA
jgi:hypothetical protein